MDEGQRLTFDLKAAQSLGVEYRSGGGVGGDGIKGSSLYDLSAVANGTTEHHAEDHPNDHDSSDADAHVPNDEELAVEELHDASLAVLGICFVFRAGANHGPTTVQYFLVGDDQCAVVAFIVGCCVEALNIFNNLVFV